MPSNRSARIAPVSRRALLAGAGAAALAGGALAQQPAPAPQMPPAAAPAAPALKFGYEDVVARARDLAARPYAAATPPLPEALANLSYDRWREIRFRPDKALLAGAGPFRLQMFHPGFLYRRPVTVNVVRAGVPLPTPYAAGLFDYGGNVFDKALPVDLGFAGFRLHAPLNDPRVHDELIAFLGASYFRFLGRGQRYGLSARGLAIGVGAAETEEFPHFSEFWIEAAENGADRAVIYALLDGASVAGAFQFHVYPAAETAVEVVATLFARRPIARLGLAPLTSMFFSGENEPRRLNDDFRPELHDSDGLMLHSGSGEWIWRPLRNPQKTEFSAFVETNLRGFGLMQRDRVFEHYQDLDMEYHLRPGYWVEPREGFGEGRVELVEIPTGDETNDNIVAYWTPKQAIEPGQQARFSYRVTSIGGRRLNPGGFALNTFQTEARARGSAEPPLANTRRFIVDFVGGELPYFLGDPGQVQIVPSISAGKILRTFVVPNAETKGFRAAIDVQLDNGHPADLRAFLRAGPRALTETWLYPVGR
ncbi:MAG: glucan biosynthesis protein G [Methylobacteriaceae bacterium]|nr:glucan biosynthesis protein G [Methylobacteriaceae bacterium]